MIILDYLTLYYEPLPLKNQKDEPLQAAYYFVVGHIVCMQQ